MKNPIRVGRLREGIYYVDKLASPTTQINAVGSYNLWHLHQAHPLDKFYLSYRQVLILVVMGIKNPVIFVFVPKKHVLNLLLVKVMKKNYLD